LAIAPNQQESGPKVAITLLDPGAVRAGAKTVLRLRAVDSSGAPLFGLKDIRVLVYQPPGLWQVRQWARETADGTYEVDIDPPEAGQYKLAVECLSRGLTFSNFQTITLSVGAPSEAKPQ
jgi:hypothetical protein